MPSIEEVESVEKREEGKKGKGRETFESKPHSVTRQKRV